MVSHKHVLAQLSLSGDDITVGRISPPLPYCYIKTLTKLRFLRNILTDAEKEKFKELLQNDDFYKIRLPSNVLSLPGRNCIVSAVKACAQQLGGTECGYYVMRYMLEIILNRSPKQ